MVDKNRGQGKVKKNKRKRRQVTCLCHKYVFPHRLGGSKCDGSLWARSYFEVVQISCNRCNAHNGSVCEVAEGREDIAECAGYQEWLLHPSSTRLPTTPEEELEKLYQDTYYDLPEEYL
jgi:hypothetical protein